MKLKINILACILLIANISVFAQSNQQKKADKLFNQFCFFKAADAYHDLINENNNTAYATRKLAACFTLMRNPESASFYYKQVVEQNNVPVENYYNYGQALRGVEKYEESRTWLNRYKNEGGSTDISTYLNDAEFVTSIFNAKQQYFLEPVIFNTKLSEFGAYQRDGKIYFTSSRDAGVSTKFKSGWDNEPFLDIYVTEKGSIDSIVDNKSKIKGRVNSVYHDGPLTITNEGHTMYFSRNNFNKNTLQRDNQEIGNLKIYKASLVKDSWKKIKELPFNGHDYSTGHPALNNDGSKLYFASDMPGGHGGTDIYYVDIKKDGSMGKPQNLGDIVNTEKNEVFPFVNTENVLFFSSDGHLGLGLLDIFSAVSDKKNKITNVINLGIPVNSSKDDFSFFMNEDGLSGYLSSNRDGGVGSDDIYAYNRELVFKVEGSITDALTNKPIQNAVVTLLNENNTQIDATVASSNGYYALNINKDSNYIITGNHKNYNETSTSFSSNNINKGETSFITDLILNPIEIIPNKEVITEFTSIYFEFNQSKISQRAVSELDKIVNIMLNEYPKMTIKIESHTDSRGHLAYNDKLSQRRADTAYNYLISKGIDASRVVSHDGYGDRKLINSCDDSSSCSEEQHRENRRTQFIVVKI
jgi:outer membrane protein OmpA-like peptidoglycan-associated protein/tetratricopeptide (TPR) repeat protein